MPLLHRTALAVALLAAAPLASAATSDAFDVTINITNACDVTATDMAFGDTASLATTGVPATSTVSVACSNQGAFTVAFSTGSDPTATFATRKMSNGAGSTVDYSLYSDAAHANVLGSGATGSSTVTLGDTSAGNYAPRNFTIHGWAPAGQGNKPTGTYTDTVTATVSF